jgi:hypothetical protein
LLYSYTTEEEKVKKNVKKERKKEKKIRRKKMIDLFIKKERDYRREIADTGIRRHYWKKFPILL